MATVAVITLVGIVIVLFGIVNAIPGFLASGEAQRASETVAQTAINGIAAFASTTIGGLVMGGLFILWLLNKK